MPGPNPAPATASLPAWAHWLAQDADGTWWAFEAEPHAHDSGWYENEVGRYLRLTRHAPNPGWEHSLQRITRR